jgi:hypothetical protein
MKFLHQGASPTPLEVRSDQQRQFRLRLQLIAQHSQTGKSGFLNSQWRDPRNENESTRVKSFTSCSICWYAAESVEVNVRDTS